MSKNEPANIAIKNKELKIKVLDSKNLETLCKEIDLEKLKFNLSEYLVSFDDERGRIVLDLELVREIKNVS